MKKAVLLLFAAICISCVQKVFAVDIFLKISNITGNSVTSGFTGYFELNNIGSTTVTCATTTPGNPCPVVSREFVFSMYNSTATPTLYLRQAQGVVIPTMDFVYTKLNGGSGIFVYYQIHLENVVIKSIADVANSGDIATTQYTIAYDKASWKFTPQNTNGTTGPPVVTCYNFATGNTTCSTNFPF